MKPVAKHIEFRRGDESVSNLRNWSNAMIRTAMKWLTAPAIVLAIAPLSLADVMSTWVDGAPDDFWSSAENWTPAEVPNNGMDTYEVTADGAAIVLDISVTIDKLTLNLTSGSGVTIFGSGQSLTVEGPTIVDLGFFNGSGTFEPDGLVDIGRTLYLGGQWNMTASNTLLGTGVNNAEIVLDTAAVLENTGTFEFLNDSTVTNFGTTETLLKNSDLMLKSAGTGTSTVSVPFENNGGTVQVASGTLSFTNQSTLNGGSIEVAGNGTARFSGAITAGGNVILDAQDTGEIIFNNTVIESAATLSGTGVETATIKATGSGTRLSNVMLDFDPNVAFELRSSTLGENGQVTNQGATELFSTTVKGAGLQNNAGAELSIVPGQASTTTIDAATLNNQGTVRQLTNFQVKSSGTITNSGTWRFEGSLANVNLAAGAVNTAFNNIGQILVQLPSSSNDAIIHVPFTSPGTVQVRNGELRIDKPYLDGTVFEVDPSDPEENYFAELSFGLSNASTGGFKTVNFLMADGGNVRFHDGTFEIADLIGASGQGTLTNFAKLIAQQPARLEGSATAPFVMSGDVQADATVINTGVMRWESGSVTGTGEFQNQADLNVNSVLNVSGQQAQGTFVNQAEMTVGNGRVVILGDMGVLRNDPDGTITFNGDAAFFRQPSTSNQLFENTGMIFQTAIGGADIQTPFKQTAGRTEAKAGTIALTGPDADLLGGTLAATSPNASIVIEAPSTSDGVDYDFENNGSVVYQGLGVTHEFTGILPGSGRGQAVLRTATMRPVALAEAGFEFANTSAFRVESGTLGAINELVKNHGTFEQDGGDVIGLFSNESAAGGEDPTIAGLYSLSGGRLQATFQNNGDFVWRDGGTIDGSFTNNAMDSVEMVLEGDDPLVLASNSTLTNNGSMRHAVAATLEMGENSTLINNASTDGGFEFTNGGDVSVTGSAVTNATFVNNGQVTNTSDLNSSISVRYESTGGTLETTAAGDLTLSGVIGGTGNDIEINSGMINAAESRIQTSGAALSGTITHNCGADGRVDHANSLIDANLIASGEGPVNLENAASVEDGQFALTTASSNRLIVVKNTCAIKTAGTSVGPGRVVFDNTNVSMDGPLLSGRSFRVDSDVELRSDVGGMRITSDLSPFTLTMRDFTIAPNRVATLIGSQKLLLDGAEIVNEGTFLIESPNGGIGATGSGLKRVSNVGTLIKQPSSTGVSQFSCSFANSGTVTVLAGQLESPLCDNVSNAQLDGGIWEAMNGSTIILGGHITPLGDPILTNDATVRLSGAGAALLNFPNGQSEDFQVDGRFELYDGATFSLDGEYENNGVTIVGPGSTLTVKTLDNDGAMIVNGTLNFTDTALIESGCTGGTGTVNGSTVTNNACLDPGESPGMLTVNADIVNTATASLLIELAGPTPGSEHDLLFVNGDVSLDGMLDVSLLDDFMPGASDEFTILSANTLSGTFTNAPADSNGFGMLDLPQGTLTIEYTANSVRLVDFRITGDLDGDGDVDLDDYAMFAPCLAGPNVDVSGAPTGCSESEFNAADLNGDGAVDAADYAIFAQSLASTPAP
jgi:hypothetical protein